MDISYSTEGVTQHTPARDECARVDCACACVRAWCVCMCMCMWWCCVFALRLWLFLIISSAVSIRSIPSNAISITCVSCYYSNEILHNPLLTIYTMQAHINSENFLVLLTRKKNFIATTQGIHIVHV